MISLILIAGHYKEICSVHPIWCTPPVRFVDLKLEMDEAALKKVVEGHDADAVDEVAVLAADAAAVVVVVVEAAMDVETGVLFEVVKEIADEVNGDSDVASDGGLVEADAEDAGWAGVVVEAAEEVVAGVEAADDVMAFLVIDAVADLIVAVAVVDLEEVADFVAFD